MNHCHNRFCPNCAERKSIKLARRFLPVIQHYESQGYACRFLTLTIPNIEVLTRPALAGLFAAWGKLRRQKLFKDVIGTLACLEITKNEADGSWHPHLHILLLGSKGGAGYIEQETVSRAWERLTGGPIVDIRKTRSNTLSELLKYPVKATDLDTAGDLKQAADALAGLQMVRATGVLRGVGSLLNELALNDACADELGDLGEDFIIVGVFNRGSSALDDWLNGASIESIRARGRPEWRWVN